MPRRRPALHTIYPGTGQSDFSIADRYLISPPNPTRIIQILRIPQNTLIASIRTISDNCLMRRPSIRTRPCPILTTVISILLEVVATSPSRAVALATVAEADVERAEDGDGGAHYCGCAFGGGPDEHINCVVWSC